jgi:hypothetical protein
LKGDAMSAVKPTSAQHTPPVTPKKLDLPSRLARFAVTAIKALPRRSGSVGVHGLSAFVNGTKQLVQRLATAIASGARRVSTIIQNGSPIPPANTVFHSAADKLTNADTALINNKLRDADAALISVREKSAVTDGATGDALATQQPKSGRTNTIGLEDGFTRDFIADLTRAQYFWQSPDGKTTPILSKTAYAQETDPEKQSNMLASAKSTLKSLSSAAGVDEATLMRTSHQAHQGIFGFVSGALQESETSPLALNKAITALNGESTTVNLPSGTQGQLSTSDIHNSYVLSSDGAGGIKVIAISEKINCEAFLTASLDTFELDPVNSFIKLGAELVIPKHGPPRLITASYDLNLDFVQT